MRSAAVSWRNRLLASGLLAGAVVLGFLSAQGCNIVGPLFFLAHGPEKIPQVYELDPERPTVVFLDDRSGTIAHSQLREAVTNSAEREMLDHKVVKTLIDSRAASTVVLNEPRGELMSISEVGREVGAAVVVYAVPESFTLSPDGQTFAPTATLRVKILDAEADTRLWPVERDGYLLQVVATTRQGAPPRGQAETRAAELEFATFVGRRIAEMFYSHERSTVSDERMR